MVPKVEIVRFFLLILFLVQPSLTAQTENEKLEELTEKFDRWQAEVKSQMEMLTKKLQSKQDETSEQSCTSSGKDISLSKKKEKTKITSSKDAAQSCQELRKKGHFANGIYQVEHQAETKQIEAVSCEFIAANDIRGDPIGYIDFKTKSAHFQVQRSSEFTEVNAIIPFEIEKFNIGGAMDSANGVFTAPVTGIYHFDFSGMTKDHLQIILRVNDVENVAFTSVSAPQNSLYDLSVSLSSSVRLNVSDKVSVYKSGDGTLSSEIIPNTPSTFFSGWLVEEI